MGTPFFFSSVHPSLVPRLLCRGGGKRAWYTLFVHAPSSLGNLHTIPKLQSISVYLLKACISGIYTPCETHTGGFEVRNNIALTVTVCIALFVAIGELQKSQSHAAVFSWTHGEFLQAKS